MACGTAIIDSIALTPDAILKASLLFIRNAGWYLCKSLKRDGTHLHFKPPPLLSWPWTDSQDFSALNGRTDGEQEKFYWIFIYPSPIHWENCYFRKMLSPRESTESGPPEECLESHQDSPQNVDSVQVSPKSHQTNIFQASIKLLLKR